MIYLNPAYKTNQYNNCSNACFLNYAKYYGIGLDEDELFFHCNGFQTWFMFDLEQFKVYSTDTVKVFCEQMKISYYTESFISKETVIQYIKNRIPITVFVDTAVLGYHKLFSLSTRSRHLLNIVGVNEEQDKILVSDGFIPSQPPSSFFGWTDDSFLPLIHDIIIWDQKSIQECARRLNLETIRRELQCNIAMQLDSYLNGDEKDGVSYGLSILSVLADVFEHFVEIPCPFNEEELLLFINSIAFNGLFIGKIHLKTQLIKMNLTDYIDELNQLIHMYYVFRTLVFKASLTYKKDMFNKISTLCKNIYNTERDVLGKIKTQIIMTNTF